MAIDFPSMHSDVIGTTYEVTEETVRSARLTVARMANGVDDCRELLMMLGLIPCDFHYHGAWTRGKRGVTKISGNSTDCKDCL